MKGRRDSAVIPALHILQDRTIHVIFGFIHINYGNGKPSKCIYQ